MVLSPGLLLARSELSFRLRLTLAGRRRRPADGSRFSGVRLMDARSEELLVLAVSEERMKLGRVGAAAGGCGAGSVDPTSTRPLPTDIDRRRMLLRVSPGGARSRVTLPARGGAVRLAVVAAATGCDALDAVAPVEQTMLPFGVVCFTRRGSIGLAISEAEVGRVEAVVGSALVRCSG